MSASKRAADDARGDVTPPKKKKANLQRYRDAYNIHWPFLTRSDRGEYYVRCTICSSDFKCSHAGKNDCERHVGSKTHKELASVRLSNRSMTSFTKKTDQETTHKRAVTRAEVLSCELIAELNLPLSSADTFNKAFKIMFPDSKIVQDMKCARNKATAIILDLAKMTQKTLSERLKSAPYSISTDGSNDAKSKQYPLVVRTRDTKTGLVNSELLSIPICNGSATGEHIFSLIDKELSERDIGWKNCLALGSDNASVMTGQNKGVIKFVKDKQPNVFMSGCVLHLIHIAAKKAAEALPSIDDVLIDIFYFFNKSDTRKLAFKGSQDLYDIEQKRMLQHVCTRWLSIGRCLDRMLVNWDPLKDYFYKEHDLLEKKKEVKKSKSQTVQSASTSRKNTTSSSKKGSIDKEENTKKVEPSYAEKKVDSIFAFIKSPTNKLYCIFLSYTIKVYDEVLKNLQAEDPRIHKVRGALHSIMRNLLSRFVTPAAMVGKSVDEVQYTLSYNQKVDAELVIGCEAKDFIKNKETNHLREHRIKDFYKSVRQYFIKSCDYIKAKLPLNEPVLIHAEVADIDKKSLVKQSSIEFFVERFPVLIPDGATIDILVEQFVLYQSYDVTSEVEGYDRVDEKWNAIENIKDQDGNLMFNHLARFILGILCIPHSSAHCERVFSVVRKNRTDQRASLGTKLWRHCS